MIKYPDLATNGYFNTEIHTQFKMKKRNSEIESGIELNEEFIAQEIEKYQALLESGIIERVSNEEQVPVKKLVPNENQ